MSTPVSAHDEIMAAVEELIARGQTPPRAALDEVNVPMIRHWAEAIGDTDPALQTQLRTQGNQVGAGVNWYQAGHGFKAQADYHYIFGDDAAHGRHQARVQVQVSF